MNLTRHRVDDRSVSRRQLYRRCPPPGRSPRCPAPWRRPRHGSGSILLDDEPAQPAAVVIEKFRRTHRPRHEDRFGRQAAAVFRTFEPAREHPQQPVGQIIEIALALTPIGVVLIQHARAHRVLHALDRGFRRQPAFDGFAQAPVPAFVVREHAIGFEHIAVLADRRQMLMLEHLVDVCLQLVSAARAVRFRRPGCPTTDA